jgi:hypothetical protein
MGGMYGSHGSGGSDHELFGDATDEFLTDTKSKAKEKADDLGLDGVHSHQHKDHTHFMPGESHADLRDELGVDDGRMMDSDPMETGSDGMGELFTRGNEIFDTDNDGGIL